MKPHNSLDAAVELCLNQFLGYSTTKSDPCYGCNRDLDITHHPNNYDCPDYKPIKIHYFYVEPKPL